MVDQKNPENEQEPMPPTEQGEESVSEEPQQRGGVIANLDAAAAKIEILHRDLSDARGKRHAVEKERDALKTEFEQLKQLYADTAKERDAYAGKEKKRGMLSELSKSIDEGFELPNIAELEKALDVIPYTAGDDEGLKNSIALLIDVAKRPVQQQTPKRSLFSGVTYANQPQIPAKNKNLSLAEAVKLKETNPRAYADYLNAKIRGV